MVDSTSANVCRDLGGEVGDPRGQEDGCRRSKHGARRVGLGWAQRTIVDPPVSVTGRVLLLSNEIVASSTSLPVHIIQRIHSDLTAVYIYDGLCFCANTVPSLSPRR